MKSIIVKEENMEKINNTIKEVEGRASARLLSYSSIQKAITEVENSIPVAKKYMVGVKVHLDVNAQDFPKAYRYTPDSTHVVIERTKSAWKLIDVHRGTCGGAHDTYDITLTDNCKKEILSYYERLYARNVYM